MQEYILNIKDAFRNGLRPELDMPIGSPVLYQCDFVKPTSRGVLDPVIVENPNAGILPFTSWPFPQILRGREVTLLADSISLYVINETTWTKALETTYDFHATTSLKSIVAGGSWHLMDSGPTWVITNGVCAVTKNSSGKALVESTVPFQTGCAHLGRGIFAGFDPAGVWPNAWDTIFDTWMDASPSTFDETTVDIGENFVLWSPIGRDLYALFTPPSDVINMMRQNQFGFMPMPWQGTVYSVKPLGKDIIVYGENGVARLFPVTDPYPTFGLESLLSHGVAGRGAVGGDRSEHVFIDIDGCLWRIKLGEGLQRLGYEEFFVWFVGQEIAISLDTKLREFYLSGENYDGVGLSYILTQTGLGTSKQILTSVVNAEGNLYGVYDVRSGSNATIATDRLDFGYKDWKTVTTVELGIDTTQDIWVAVDFRNGPADGWERTSWVSLNSSGWGRIQKTAKEFRVAIKVDSYIDLALDYMNIHWQPCGKMTKRCLSVNTA